MAKTPDTDDRAFRGISFRAPPELIAHAEATAAAEDTTRSAVIRRALRRDLARADLARANVEAT